MNIATDIKIDGKTVTVYGHYTAGNYEQPAVRYECADDENGDAVDLNEEAEVEAVRALLIEAKKLHALYYSHL
jgi:hypothetical protein